VAQKSLEKPKEAFKRSCDDLISPNKKKGKSGKSNTRKQGRGENRFERKVLDALRQPDRRGGAIG